MGFGILGALGLEGLLDADGENIGAVLAITPDRAIKLQALDNLSLDAHLQGGFLALVTEHFDVGCDAAHLTLKSHAPAAEGLFIFGVVACHVDVNGASSGVASQNADQKGLLPTPFSCTVPRVLATLQPFSWLGVMRHLAWMACSAGPDLRALA